MAVGRRRVVGGGVSNLAAYLLWPRDFPETIAQSIHNLSERSGSPKGYRATERVLRQSAPTHPGYRQGSPNGGKLPDGFLAGPRSLIGYAVLVLVVVSVLALGRRIPPVMVGHRAAGHRLTLPPSSSTTTWYSFCRSLRSLSETPTGRRVLGYSTGLQPTAAAVVQSASA